MLKIAVFGLLLTGLATAPAGAQRRIEPAAGAPRVLLVPEGGQTTVAASRVLPWPAGPHGELLDAAAPSVQSVAPARGVRRSVARYRLIGTLAGLAVGVLGYYVTGYQDDYCRDSDLMSCDIGFAVYGAVGAAAGGLAGHVIGTLAPPTYPPAPEPGAGEGQSPAPSP
jgi:hypothetical protein